MRPAPPPQNLTARERLAKALTLRLLKLAPYTTISLILTEQLSKQLLGKSAL